MKTFLSIMILSGLFIPFSGASAREAQADRATISTELTPGEGRLVVEAKGILPQAPLFFSVAADNTIRLGSEEVLAEIHMAVQILQGRPEVISLGLEGSGEIMEVSGAGLADWSVRHTGSRRTLDLRPVLKDGQPGPREMQITALIKITKPKLPGTIPLPTLSPGSAVGFSSLIKLVPGDAVDVRITTATGLTPAASQSQSGREQILTGAKAADLVVSLSARGAALAPAELIGAQLTGKLDAPANSVRFVLTGQARVSEAGARLPLLSGQAALSESAAGDGWHVEIKEGRSEIVFDRAGTFPLSMAFAAALGDGEWRTLDFQMPAGAVVPMQLEGLPETVAFNPDAAVVPDAASRRGFLAANGSAAVGWRELRSAGADTLSFTSQELVDLRVSPGLLRQASKINFRILQGKLPQLRVSIDGPGEILSVEGENVLGWKVIPEGSRRTLAVQLSRPFEKNGTLVVRSQTPLGNFPLKAEPLRLTPEGGVRHSGAIRLANDGAVRLEVTDTTGLIQLAPSQFPGPELENVRQVFAYRFPSANYGFRVAANQILPEVAVSQILLYQLTETDRVIAADLELDIREAPLRDWTLAIPEDYTVVSVSGERVADYAAESAARDGSRLLKILFASAVDGRQLIRLRLEKNQAATAGDWILPQISYPGAKSVRGHIGVVATPGYRILPGTMEKLTEMPLSYFPAQMPGLQQAFRQRDPLWAATLKVEATGQSIQADVFHLYSLKEGVVRGSVLINYFVVGAPANTWRIEVPASAGNIDVVGQNVRRDWRREGNEIIISLHQPVLGAATLLVTFEQPMSARGGTIQPGEVRPIGVQAERGFIQVASPLLVKPEILKAEGSLLKLEPLELPAEFRLLNNAPSLAVYQYTARPFELALNIKWFAPAETADQVVDFAKLSSRISREGEVVTEATYFVKTRGRKALRLILPPEVRLWEARADKAIAHAQIDGDQTLIPLPPKLNPNDPVEVVLRLGQTAANPGTPTLAAPRTLAPTVISEWVISGDPGQLITDRGGSIQPVAPTLTETGFEWISTRAPVRAILLLAALAIGGVLVRSRSAWKALIGFSLAGAVVFSLLSLALSGMKDRRPNISRLTYSAAVVPAGDKVEIHLRNLNTTRTMLSPWGVATGAAGLLLVGLGALPLRRGKTDWKLPAGFAFLAAGILAQRGGAPVFFLSMAFGVFFFLLLPTFIGWLRRPRPSLQSAPAAILIFLLGLFLPVVSASAQTSRPAESIAQSWQIREGRLFGELDVQVRGNPGDSFLLLRPPAVLTKFEGDEGLRLTKSEIEGQVLYFIALDRAGSFRAKAAFEMQTGSPIKDLPIVSGPAAVQRIAVRIDQGGWEFASASAVSVQQMTGLPDGQSGASLILRPSDAPTITLRTRTRNTAAETPRFFAEAANQFIPAPGVVNGYNRIVIRPVQGQISILEVDIPKGFTVSEVRNGPVSLWRFDPKTSRLRIEIAPAQAAPFQLEIETQLTTADLPVNLKLEPLRVVGADGDIGMIGLAFGSDAQPENVSGQSPVNLEDFGTGLIPIMKDGQPRATLQHAFRYSRDGGGVTLTVAPVAPEVRVTSKQVFSFGDDRLVLAADLSVSISRAGLFKLSFPLPDGLEVESISGSALSQWTQADENGRIIITLQLNGRTIGEHQFALSLVGTAPPAQNAWPVPHLLVREATRQTGEIFLTPEKGLRLRVVKRENVSQIDSRASGDLQAGTLAYRLLQADWNLVLGIETLEPWVTVQALQEATIREGQTLTRLGLRYRVDNAAVRQFRFRLPGLSEAQAQTVRGSGAAVNDLVKVPGEDDLWEVRLQRGIVGETDIQIEYQGQAKREQGREDLRTPVFEGVRQVTQFVSARGTGRIELDAPNLPRGWQRVDWSTVPAHLQDLSDRSVPALCFRVAEPEGPLAVNIQRHDVADALKLRTKQAELTTLLSPQGPSLTTFQLELEVVEKSSLRVTLPETANLVSAFVNDASVVVVRDGQACLLSVSPNAETDRTAKVRMIYSVPDAKKSAIDLLGPSLNIPLVNVSWRVLIPPGQKIAGHRGNLRLNKEETAGLFGLQDYLELSSAVRKNEAQKAAGWIDEANVLLSKGEQQKAGEVLSKAANTLALDEASNEDARVQLKSLMTQQAIVGLNTRRQRLYLDNRRNDAAQNEQFEQAANANPVIQGANNVDLQQIDQYLAGNTAEENSALSGIAGRIVEQQLLIEPAPGEINVTLPQSGKAITFTRTIQVDGESPLALRLQLAPSHGTNIWFAAALLLAIGACVTISIVNPFADLEHFLFNLSP